jgi:lipopolysaccharide export system protein LptC
MARALLLGVTAVTSSACRFERPPDAQTVAPELRLEGVRFRIYRAEALHAYGTADVASLRRDSSVLRAQTLDTVLPRAGDPVRFAAPVGEGLLSARTFDVSGGVTAERGEDHARTATAHYQPDGGKDGLVQGSDPVTVEGRGYRLDGRGFTLDPAAGRIVVRGGARLLAGLAEADR